MLNLIKYRFFRNADPPKLLRLWDEAKLGRGAVTGVTCDAFEALNYAQPYFDPRGLIVACDGSEIVGFSHAGFGCNTEESALNYDSGVVCAVIVHPNFRRRGIGTALVSHAEAYLREKKAKDIFAGPAWPLDPFYFGLYGGIQPSGFLETDVDAAPFFAAIGYERCASHSAFQNDISDKSIPVNFRISALRRRLSLRIVDEPEHPTWWWRTRYGRLDALRFVLAPKSGSMVLAGLTAVGLDLYLPKWNERAIGISEIYVGERERRQGFGQLLLVELIKQVRQQMVTSVMANIADSNQAAIQLVESLGFVKVDTGIVYRRK